MSDLRTEYQEEYRDVLAQAIVAYYYIPYSQRNDRRFESIRKILSYASHYRREDLDVALDAAATYLTSKEKEISDKRHELEDALYSIMDSPRILALNRALGRALNIVYETTKDSTRKKLLTLPEQIAKEIPKSDQSAVIQYLNLLGMDSMIVKEWFE